ncbi:MAG: response regulator [Deltaproteobacteria bacterium]|nr:response regulator [Deltaproteobacteria bacterium]
MAAAPSRMLTSLRSLPASGSGVARGGHAAVLVVDADAARRSVLEARLRGSGYEPLGVGTAEEAREALLHREPLPVAAVVDEQLPDGDGLTLCAYTRAEARTAALPLVLVSGAVDPSLPARAHAAGADEVLFRPLYAADLVTWVELLAGRSPADGTVTLQAQALPVQRVLRALLCGRRPCRLVLGDDGGEVHVVDGAARAARFGTTTGERALQQVALFSTGSYHLSFGPTSADDFAVDVRAWAADYEPGLRRWERLLPRSVPLDAVLVQGPGVTAAPAEAAPLLRLFDGHRTVRECLVASPEGEVEGLEAVTLLYVHGALTRPVPPRPQQT